MPFIGQRVSAFLHGILLYLFRKLVLNHVYTSQSVHCSFFPSVNGINNKIQIRGENTIFIRVYMLDMCHTIPRKPCDI